jgi:Na+-translocating ferredoxin:NAD+ oxidoreductase RnfG subunit
MIVVTPDDRIDRIEVLRFDEPPEYLVPDDWIAQLEGKALDDELSLKGSVVNMTGATLTSEAIVAAGRRALAVHAVIRPLDRGNE